MNYFTPSFWLKKMRALPLLTLTGFFLFLSNLSGQPLKYTVNTYQTTNKGYYFLYTFKMRKEAEFKDYYQMILNEKGQTVYYKSIKKSSDFKLQANGLITFLAEDSSFHLMNESLMTIGSVRCKNRVFTDPHDFQILHNGHYLLIGYEFVTMDLSSYNMFLQKDMAGSVRAIVKCGVIQELDKNKKVVFEWHAKDHFSFDDIDKYYLKDTLNIDWTHINSVELDNDGNILISVRFFNEITKINRKDGSVIWRMGGKRNQFRFTDDTIPFLGHHDARRLNNGNITLFDNGYTADITRRHPARALEYHIDEKNKIASLAWSYMRNPPVISESTGNMQRINNGNTLINYGQLLNDNLMFEVVDSLAKKIFDIRFDDSIGTYRAFYYPKHLLKLNAPELVSIRSGNDTYLKALHKGKSCLWSTGDTTQTIKIDKPGKYFVYVPYGDGGYISSQLFVVPPQENLIQKKKVK